MALGDERSFCRIAEVGGTYKHSIIIEPYKKYEVYIYFHNNACVQYNDEQYGRSATARKVWMSSRFSHIIKPDKCGGYGAIIQWTNFNLKSIKRIWCYWHLFSSRPIELCYISDSLKMHNNWKLDGTTLPEGNPYKESNENGVFSNGCYLGLDKLDDLILGGAEFSGHVNYTLEAKPL